MTPKDNDHPYTAAQRLDLSQLPLVLPAIVDGELFPLSATDDPIIGQSLIGQGYAIRPISEQIYAPIVGEVTHVAPTRHALTLTTPSGESLLIHVGINTIELKGKAFKAHVEQGDRIEVGDLLLTVDLAYLAEKEYSNYVCLIILDQPGRQLEISLPEQREVEALVSPALKVQAIRSEH